MTEASTWATKLSTRLETELPSPLEVGRGTAIFLEGRCSHPERPIRKLEVVMGSARIPVSADGMPRPGTVSHGDWWWAFVPVAPVDQPTRAEVWIRAHFAGGGFEEGLLGALKLVPRDPIAVDLQPRSQHEDSLIAVCMATYNPPLDLFKQQVDSIRSQTHENWVCLISDDCSDDAASRGMQEIIGDDDRFYVSQAPRRGGFYRNFGRALSLCPPEVTHVALSDQDDRWYPDKLERLLGALEPGSHLAYSDARIVDESGQTISETYWRDRRNNFTNFTSLLLANTITGAASLYSAELVRHVLPFPPPQGNIYHDHWIATVAMALGPISYVDEPLYEYVQHDRAVVGHARANSGARRPRRGSGQGRRAPKQRSRNWRSFYFGANCRIALFSRVLEMRCGDLMPPKKRRVVRRLSRIAEAPGLLPWLTIRANRRRFGWDETAGREQVLAKGLAWRLLTPARVRYAPPRGEARHPTRSVMEARRELRAAREWDARAWQGQSSAAASTEAPWLTPLLVDYFARDGSTLMMRLLGTSPEIVIDDKYPFERKYFAYLWRWSRLLDRSEWPREDWKLSDLGSLHQEATAMMLGPPPWLPRKLFDEAGSGSFSQACFEAAWSEFSRRAVSVSHDDQRVAPRYYAEKHLNTWEIDLAELPQAKLIVLLRDPRDTFVSIKTFAEQRGADFGRARVSSDQEYLELVVSRQKKRLRWIEQLLEEGQIPVVRYEELVSDFDGAAKRLEAALSIQLNPKAAQSDRDLRKRHSTTKNPASSIGRWRTELTDEEVDVFDQTLGEQLASLGFPA